GITVRRRFDQQRQLRVKTCRQTRRFSPSSHLCCSAALHRGTSSLEDTRAVPARGALSWFPQAGATAEATATCRWRGEWLGEFVDAFRRPRQIFLAWATAGLVRQQNCAPLL